MTVIRGGVTRVPSQRIADGRAAVRSVAIEASTWNRRRLYPLLPGDGGFGADLFLLQAMSGARE